MTLAPHDKHPDNPLLGPLSRAEFITANLPLVKMIAERFIPRANERCIPFDDVISEGTIGLILAYDRYSDATNTFSTFAVPYIRGYIQRLFKYGNDIVSIPQHLKDTMYAIIRDGLEDTPTRDIAKALGVSTRSAHEAKIIANIWTGPLEKTDDDGNVIGEPADSDDLTEIYVDAFVDRLDERQRTIVAALMSGMTQSDIARDLGVSRQVIYNELRLVRTRYERLNPAA